LNSTAAAIALLIRRREESRSPTVRDRFRYGPHE
jgi:hypothetical protein